MVHIKQYVKKKKVLKRQVLVERENCFVRQMRSLLPPSEVKPTAPALDGEVPTTTPPGTPMQSFFRSYLARVISLRDPKGSRELVAL